MARRLGPEGLRLRDAVTDKYELSEHEQVLLDSACRLADHVALLDAAVVLDGVTVPTATGAPKVNPALTEARQGRLALSKLLTDLALPVNVDDDAPKRESPGTLRARVAAKARHDRNLARINRKGGTGGTSA
jgi:hypothetical protein